MTTSTIADAARALSDATLFPLRLDSPAAPTPEPNLIGRTSADLVIVGGGFTGLVIATEPLSAERMARVGWAHRQGLYDTRTQLNYTRLTRDNRIVFGGRVGYFFNDNVDPEADRDIRTYHRLAAWFHRTFPQLSDVRFTQAWSGPIAISTCIAVHFQSSHGGKVIWTGGYSGFGVTTSRFGARVGLDKLFGRATPELEPDFARSLPSPIPASPSAGSAPS